MQAESNPVIRVAVADDHAVVREGVRSLLNNTADMQLVGEASDGIEAVELYRQRQPTVLLLDISMPAQNGLTALQTIIKSDPDARVLMFTRQPEEQHALTCLRAGASGYLEKSQECDTIVDAIRLVASNKVYISPRVANMLADDLSSLDTRPAHEKLSVQEYQIMLHLAAGKTLTQTGEEMGLSSRTISTYRKRILKKLNLACAADIVQYAYRNKLLFA